MNRTKEQIEAADEGAQRAIDHADRVHEMDWAEVALSKLAAFLADENEQEPTFTCETIRAYAEEKGCPPPPDTRAWGGIMKKAANLNLIVKAGISFAGSHGRYTTLWTPRYR